MLTSPEDVLLSMKTILVLLPELTSMIHLFSPYQKCLFSTLLLRTAGTLTALDSFGGIFSALKRHFLIQLGVYNQFADVLGSFPLVLGFANVLTAIYSQFEEY